MGIRITKDSFSIPYAPSRTERPPGVLYPRIIELRHSGPHNGTLYATFEEYTYETPSFPIYRSRDGGKNWALISRVQDPGKRGLRYQPHLFEVPQDTGCLKQGDLLCAGSQIPERMDKTTLQLYRSRDLGATWEYLSTIVSGGPAATDNPDRTVERPVWEPYLYLDRNGDLVVYYSDERFLDRGYNQLLAHQVSKDGGLSWGAEVFDVAIPDGKLRPGMPIVVKLPNGKYFMVYEMVGMTIPYIYGRFSDDGLDWGDPADYGTLLACEDGFCLASTPYVVWTPVGGPQGTILVSGRMSSQGARLEAPGYLLANYRCGEGFWEKVEMPVFYDSRYGRSGYSQSMQMADGDTKLLMHTPVHMSQTHNMACVTIAHVEETP